MDARTLEAMAHRLTRFLADVVPVMGRRERQEYAGQYVRGLLLDGERKSIAPLAARLPDGDVQALSQFVNQSPWPWAPVQAAIGEMMLTRVADDPVLILDETSFPKQGTKSVGVAPQYCGALGKTANCQVAVSAHWGTAQACVPMAWELFLPKAWTTDRARCRAAGVPDAVPFRTKTALGLECVDRALAAGVGAPVVLADAGFGRSHAFREALRARALPYCVQVNASAKAWTSRPTPAVAPASAAPGPRQGRPPTRLPREAVPAPVDFQAIARALPATAWHQVTWRAGTKGPLRSRFARVSVWLAHTWTRKRELPAHSVELLIQWPRRKDAPTKYWLADLHGAPLGLRRLVRLAKGRWRIEQSYREMKDELGLDHFEGRSWTGWHHHVTLVTIAHAFLTLEALRTKKNAARDRAGDAGGLPVGPPP